MKLSEEQSYDLLAKRGVYVKEACDRCGQLLGPVRYTRKGESGAGQFPPPKDAHSRRRVEFPAYCSRECRDGKDAHAPGSCKGCGARLPEGKRRGSLYCDDACKQFAYRTSKLSVTKTHTVAAFHTENQAPAMGIA